VENVAALLFRGLDRVLGDLAESGFYAEWDCVPAAFFGAAHLRPRVVLVANAEGIKVLQLSKTSLDTNAAGERLSRPWEHLPPISDAANPYWEASGLVNAVREGALPFVCRRHDGISASVDGRERVKALGNAVVPDAAKWVGQLITRALANRDTELRGVA
jgi:DNA (cytosine-5)-methyltransferase 1